MPRYRAVGGIADSAIQFPETRDVRLALFDAGWSGDDAHPSFRHYYSQHITMYNVATYRRKAPAPQLFVAASLAGPCRGRANPAMHVARNGRVSGNRSGALV